MLEKKVISKIKGDDSQPNRRLNNLRYLFPKRKPVTNNYYLVNEAVTEEKKGSCGCEGKKKRRKWLCWGLGALAVAGLLYFFGSSFLNKKSS